MNGPNPSMRYLSCIAMLQYSSALAKSTPQYKRSTKLSPVTVFSLLDDNVEAQPDGIGRSCCRRNPVIAPCLEALRSSRCKIREMPTRGGSLSFERIHSNARRKG